MIRLKNRLLLWRGQRTKKGNTKKKYYKEHGDKDRERKRLLREIMRNIDPQ